MGPTDDPAKALAYLKQMIDNLLALFTDAVSQGVPLLWDAALGSVLGRAEVALLRFREPARAAAHDGAGATWDAAWQCHADQWVGA